MCLLASRVIGKVMRTLLFWCCLMIVGNILLFMVVGRNTGALLFVCFQATIFCGLLAVSRYLTGWSFRKNLITTFAVCELFAIGMALISARGVKFNAWMAGSQTWNDGVPTMSGLLGILVTTLGYAVWVGLAFCLFQLLVRGVQRFFYGEHP
jgi:hypothetical protein